jgi:transcriptional regulator with GAF, ATPase, and Fis domain
MTSGMILDSSCFDFDLISNPGTSLPGMMSGDWRSAKKDFETEYVRRLLKKHDGNVYKAARAANLTPRSLYKILRRLGLRPGP